MKIFPSLRAVGEAIQQRRVYGAVDLFRAHGALAGLPRSLRSLAMTILVIALTCGVTACGVKGKLKSPTQIQNDEAKKEKKKEKDAQAEEQDIEQDDMIAPAPSLPNPPPQGGKE